jgi:hypothetical protein
MFTFDGCSPRSVGIGGAPRLAPQVSALSLAACLVFVLTPLAGSAASQPPPIQPAGQDPVAQPSSDRWFAETGHNVKEPFLSRWLQAGGEDVVGLPLSEERFDADSGAIEQTFAGITLVYDPTLQAPWDVQAQHLPAEFRRTLAPFDARRMVDGCRTNVGCRFFPETGHTLTGALLEFWSTRGDLAIFGLPVSEPFAEPGNRGLVQVFERAVLEAEGGGDVLVRPLARALAEQAGLFADPAFQPAPPTGGTPFLVNASDGLRLRVGPSLDADVLLVLPDNAEFIVAPGNHREWIPGYVDGFAGWVSEEYLNAPPPLPQLAVADWKPDVWQGAALGETNVRAQPSTKSRIVDELVYGDPVEVVAWVKGEEVYEGADLWAQIGPNRYVYGRNVGRTGPVSPPPLPPDAPAAGKWIDVDLTQQIMTAYEGRTPVRVVETTTGRAGWDTPPGYYTVLSRVANETMTSGAIGAEEFYKLEDVLFTQYFTQRGHAIHFAWWRTQETIGRPGSHGCLNLLLEDARFFWDWATIGTPIYIHP